MNENEEIEELFGAAKVPGALLGMEPVSEEDYDRFWKWMKVPLMDVPDDELIWCYKQDRQNSAMSKAGWASEIERRHLKVD